MIPHRLIRTVPAVTDPAAEALWVTATALHPGWEHVTLRDPVDRSRFPVTSPFWDGCETGAQLADLIRAEELWHRGGWYIDSDVLCVKPFDQLCALEGVVAWEDGDHIPNAIMGFRPGHLAVGRVLELAIERRGQGTWAAGVGVTTEVFGQERRDVVVLPPQMFYPVHWRVAHAQAQDWDAVVQRSPWVWAVHQYAASWH
jgi:hypothetical protein